MIAEVVDITLVEVQALLIDRGAPVGIGFVHAIEQNLHQHDPQSWPLRPG